MSTTTRGPGRPSTGTPIHIRVPAETLDDVDRVAAELGSTRAAVIRDVIALWAGELRR